MTESSKTSKDAQPAGRPLQVLLKSFVLRWRDVALLQMLQARSQKHILLLLQVLVLSRE
jgi:hypothetical protein